MGAALIMAGSGLIIELTKIGDNPKVSTKEDAEALDEASKFRRLEQYDHILLQRKKPRFQKLLPFSFLRNIL